MIRNLHLQNFKCFADQHLELRPLTLLTGLNGMGKSSVIQSFLLLRQSYEQGLLQRTGLALNGDLIQLGTATDAIFESATEDTIGFKVIFEDNLMAEWHFSYNQQSDFLALTTPPVDKEIYNTAIFDERFHYLQAERIGPRKSFEASDFTVQQRHQLGSRGEYTAHFLANFGDDPIKHDSLTHPQAVSNRLRDQVEAWIGEVSPGTRLNFESYPQMDLVRLSFSFVRGRDVTNQYRPGNVGFGLTYTLPILVALLASSSNGIVLLENPEAHLHPKGQAEIGNLVARAASTGTQIIVETHSDHVLNGIRLAVRRGILPPEDIKLLFFQRPNDEGETTIAPVEVISPKIDREGHIDYWPDNFFDEWDKSLLELL